MRAEIDDAGFAPRGASERSRRKNFYEIEMILSGVGKKRLFFR
jgi:hypothetical protein